MLLQTQIPENLDPACAGYAELAESCLAEVLLCSQSTAAKTYIAALVKTAAGLNLESASQEDVLRIRALAGAFRLLLHKMKSLTVLTEPALSCAAFIDRAFSTQLQFPHSHRLVLQMRLSSTPFL